MIREYRYSLLEKVIFGPGAIVRVPAEIDHLGKKRAFVVTGKSISTKTDLVPKLEALLGARFAGAYNGCQQHVPSRAVDEAVAAAHTADADIIISFGGGSTVDTAKITTLRLLGERPHDAIPHIAIGTTLSASEFTAVAGITDKSTGIKSICRDPRIVPNIVVLDPEVTVATPSELWAATGIKALDHAVEALWSLNAQPITDVLAMQAIRNLKKFLPMSIKEPDNMEARGECQLAAWLSIFGMANVGVRLSHIIGHQIGARWNIPHGVTSCIALAPCMRFLAPETLDRQALIANALGVGTAGLTPEAVAAGAAEAVEVLIDSFGLPRRLRDVGADESALPSLAHAIIEETSIWHNQQSGEVALLALLKSMW
jgi:alcohol dehydrogenase class IV